MSRALDTLAARCKHARKMRGLTQTELATAAGMRQPDITKIEQGLIQKTTGIARLAKSLRVPVEWLELGDGPEPDWNILNPDEDRKPSVDQSMSYLPDKLRLLTREHLMECADDLSGEFWVDLWDDAIGSELRRGTRTLWDADLADSPEVGDFVMIRTPDRKVHVRVYAESLADGWQGKALHRDYESIPAAEGVRVVAVFLSAKQRRSQLQR